MTIDDKTFDDVCNLAKIRLDIKEDKAKLEASINDVISKINCKELNTIMLELEEFYKDEAPELDLFNTFREDVARPSLSRDTVISTTKHHEMGCINIPVSLREG